MPTSSPKFFYVQIFFDPVLYYQTTKLPKCKVQSGMRKVECAKCKMQSAQQLIGVHGKAEAFHVAQWARWSAVHWLHSAKQYNAKLNSGKQYSRKQHCAVQNSTVPCKPVKSNTEQWETRQNCTNQWETVINITKYCKTEWTSAVQNINVAQSNQKQWKTAESGQQQAVNL